MPLTKDEISKMIMSAFPDASLELKDTMGDNNHYSAKIISKVFNGKSRVEQHKICLLYTSPSPRDNTGSRMPSSA